VGGGEIVEKQKNDDFGYVSDLTIGDTFGKGWQVAKGAFPLLIAMSIVAGLIQVPNQIISSIPNFMPMDTTSEIAARTTFSLFSSLFSIVYGLFLTGPIGISVGWAYLKEARGEGAEFSDMFAIFNRNYLNAVGAYFLMGLFIMLGALLFIIPGIYIAIRLAFVMFLVIDERMGAMEAIRASWEMTKGYAGTILGIGFLSLLITIGGLLALLIGVLLTGVWVAATTAVLYHTIATRDGIPGREKRKNTLQYS
jgi:hypothetical protein